MPDNAAGERLLAAVVSRVGQLRIDRWDAEPQPLYGPLINAAAVEMTLQAWQSLCALGGEPVMTPERLTALSPAALSPGLIDVTNVAALPDAEVFGPLLRLIRVADFDAALLEANRTAYGLSAALIGGTHTDFERFWAEVDAGICNWNRATTGALSTLPFGGTGLSGNHRPAGWTSVDYCAWPVASTERPVVAAPIGLPPGVGVV